MVDRALSIFMHQKVFYLLNKLAALFICVGLLNSSARADVYSFVKPVLDVSEYALPGSRMLRQYIVQSSIEREKPSNELGYFTRVAFNNWVGCASPLRSAQLCRYFAPNVLMGIVPTGTALIPISLCATLFTSSEFFFRQAESVGECCLEGVFSRYPLGPIIEKALWEYAAKIKPFCMMAAIIGTKFCIVQALKTNSALVSFSQMVTQRYVFSPDLSEKKWWAIIAGAYTLFGSLAYYERRVLASKRNTR